ncbi:hypothetical protein [Actinomadura sp. 21ATH]|uniref:hypothetical protein n=1 Tax=Actinomadura sp. 21ATH TaxID=1735444 RepID=UPI0035C2160C
MSRNEKHAREVAEELAEHPEDPRFRNRRPGVRAPRTISREDADADTAGLIGGTGTSGGGGPHAGSDFGRTEGRPLVDVPPDDDLDDTVLGAEPRPADDDER